MKPMFHLNHLLRLASLLGTCLLAAQCASPPQSTKSPAFLSAHRDATYCEITAVHQSKERSCGAAALSCVLQYWEKPITESALLANDPPQGKIGYPMSQLRGMALRRGLWAYAVTMETGKLDALLEHVKAGRPIITAVYFPHGKYFGERNALLGRVDRRAIKVGPATGVFKHHYVVIYGEQGKNLLLMDPAYGLVTLPKSEFLPYWKDEKYAALVCSPM